MYLNKRMPKYVVLNRTFGVMMGVMSPLLVLLLLLQFLLLLHVRERFEPALQSAHLVEHEQCKCTIMQTRVTEKHSAQTSNTPNSHFRARRSSFAQKKRLRGVRRASPRT